MIKSGKGGGNTRTGLVFEGKTDLSTFLSQQPHYSIKENDVYYDEEKVAEKIKDMYFDVVGEFIGFTPDQVERDYRLFKGKYGIGPKEYLTRVRLNKAKWLLSKEYSVAECASMVGYSDTFTFSKAYKKFYGVSPSLDINK